MRSSLYHHLHSLLLIGVICCLIVIESSSTGAQELTLPSDDDEQLGVVEEQPGIDPYVELIVSPGRFKLFNRSPYSLINLQRGQVEITELPHGSWDGDELPLKDLFDKDLPLQTLGQFKLSEWGEAMSETLPTPPKWLIMSPKERDQYRRENPSNLTRASERSFNAQKLLAEFHLRTAGMSPIAQNLSEVIMTSGTPLIEPNVIALRQSSEALTIKWIDGDHPLQTALVAHAAQFAPPNLLLRELFSQLDPKAVPSELERWRPAGYERLASAYELVRDAFEKHAQKALPALMAHEDWAKDRGFEDPLLALVLIDQDLIEQALNDREDRDVLGRFKDRVNQIMRGSLEDRYTAFLATQGVGSSLDEQRRTALEIAYRLDRVDQRPEVSLVARSLCGTLDAATQSTLNQNQLLAARAYVRLAQKVCHGSPFFLMRTASLMGTIGDRGYFKGDFESAQHWYRAALILRDDPMSRVKFIDTLSQLALRANVEGDFRRAKQLIDEARDWDSTALPHRELLALADQLLPRADHRAKLGLILIIAILGVIVTIRLLKVFTATDISTRG